MVNVLQEDVNKYIEPVDDGAKIAGGTGNATETAPAFCKNCGAPLEPGSIFCGECGTKNTPEFCVNCGTKLNPGSKFCANCGTKA